MKAIVLAGGHATRLWPITRNRAKPLLPLGKKPIVDHLVAELETVADETIISTNRKFASDFEDYIEEYNRDARVVVEDQGSEEEKPGTIGAILKILERENFEDDLLIVGGDNYFPFGFEEFMEFCRKHDGPVNAVYDIGDEQRASQFGIVDTDGERIEGFEEKPDQPPSTLASTACYYFPKQHVSLFNEYEDHFSDTDVPEEMYLDEPGRLIEWAHRKVPMFAFTFDQNWFDVGTPEGYLESQSAVIDGNLIRGETKNCSIGDNVVVMNGAELENVDIDNSIVFDNATVKNAELKNSIVDRDTRVEDVDLNDALIGAHTQL